MNGLSVKRATSGKDGPSIKAHAVIYEPHAEWWQKQATINRASTSAPRLFAVYHFERIRKFVCRARQDPIVNTVTSARRLSRSGSRQKSASSTVGDPRQFITLMFSFIVATHKTWRGYARIQGTRLHVKHACFRINENTTRSQFLAYFSFSSKASTSVGWPVRGGHPVNNTGKMFNSFFTINYEIMKCYALMLLVNILNSKRF